MITSRPGFEEEIAFELEIESCLLMLTQTEGVFPAGPNHLEGEGLPSADMVT